MTCQTYYLLTEGLGILQNFRVEFVRIFAYSAGFAQLLRLTGEADWYRALRLQIAQAFLIESSPASRMSMPAADLINVVMPVAVFVASFAHQELDLVGVICGNVLVVEVLD